MQKQDKTDTKKTPKAEITIPTDYKILQELKGIHETLLQIRDIQDNIFNERTP